jgi:hypothetical protein
MKVTINKGCLSAQVSPLVSIATLETLALLGYTILVSGD